MPVACLCSLILQYNVYVLTGALLGSLGEQFAVQPRALPTSPPPTLDACCCSEFSLNRG